jgi:glycosyltransferase involved in cell wall biosynthesis
MFVPNILKSADRVIVHSYHMNRITNYYGVKKCEVIPNAIDDYWHQNYIEEKKTTNDIINKHNYNIFYHGRLSWEKGVDILIESVENYIKNNPNTILYLAGEGPQRKKLEYLCSNLNIEKNVIFLGRLDKKQIKFFLENVDVAVYPSRFDSFSLAVLEALTCANCPVYISKNIGICDFVVLEGFKLNIFEPNVSNIVNLLNYISVNSGSKVVNCQKDFAKNYTWDSLILKYIKLYSEVINE